MLPRPGWHPPSERPGGPASHLHSTDLLTGALLADLKSLHAALNLPAPSAVIAEDCAEDRAGGESRGEHSGAGRRAVPGPRPGAPARARPPRSPRPRAHASCASQAPPPAGAPASPALGSSVISSTPYFKHPWCHQQLASGLHGRSCPGQNLLMWQSPREPCLITQIARISQAECQCGQACSMRKPSCLCLELHEPLGDDCGALLPLHEGVERPKNLHKTVPRQD